MARDKLTYAVGNSASTTLASAISNTDTSVPLTSDTNFEAESGEGMVIIGEGTANEELAYATGKTGSALDVPLANRGLEGGTAVAHDSGETVKGIISSAMWNDLVDSVALLVDKTAGTIKSSISFTTPKVVTSLNDTNGNEVFKITATGSAVNEITLTNAATGNSPIISATGGNDNVGLDIKMKGTGKMRKPSIVGLQVFGSTTDTATGNGKAFYRIPAELNGMNLTGVAACVYTAGTTGTTDIQIRNHTDTADMLSTLITIDSGETDTSTAAAAAVIDTDHDDVATGDVIAIDVDAVSTTAAQGLYVEMRFELP
jgi:hypothetical protein